MGSDRGEDPPGKISEREIIREIFLRNTPPSNAFAIGPGDDSAVLRPIKGKAVVTTDMLVQDVHFDLSYFPPDHLGEKSILVNLSDIAAMGARPLAAFVAVGLPESVEPSFVKSFARGLKRVLRRYGVALGGGDTVRAEKCVISITLLGEPIASTILAYFMLHETPSGIKIIGAILILTGIYIASRSETSRIKGIRLMEQT